MLRLKGRSCPQTAPSDSVFTKPQITVIACLFLPYIPLSIQPYHSCLHLPSAGIKGMGSQVLGSPLCELCFSFRQIQSCVTQGGLELTLPVSQILLLKVCATTPWPVWLTSVAALPSDLQASFIY